MNIDGTKLSPSTLILSYLEKEPSGTSIGHISSALGMNRNLVAKYLSILHLQGRVELRGFGNVKIYRLCNRVPFSSLLILGEGDVLGVDRLGRIKEGILRTERFSDVEGEFYEKIVPFSFNGRIRELVLNVLDGRTDKPVLSHVQLGLNHLQIRIIPCIFDNGSSGAGLIINEISTEQVIQEDYTRLFNRYTSLLEETGEYIIHMAPDEKIVFVNAAYRRCCGIPDDEIIGSYGLPLLPVEEMDRIRQYYPVLSDSSPAGPEEVKFLLPDGTLKWIEFLIYPHFCDGILRELHLVGSEITEKKLKDSTIHQFQTSLQDIINEKTGEIRTYAGKLVKEVEERKILERQLKQNEERYRNLIETTSDIIWEIDRKGKVTYCNPRIKAVLGYEPGDLINQPFLDILLPPHDNEIFTRLQQSINEQIAFNNLDLLVKGQKGDLAWIEFSGVPVFSSDGQYSGYRGIGRDITKKVNVQRQNRQLHSIIESSPDLFAMINMDGYLVYLNNAGYSLLELDPTTDLESKSYSLYLLPEDIPVISDLFARVIKTGYIEGEITLISTTGRKIPISYVIQYHSQNPAQSPIFSLNGRDISERYHYEKQLQDSYLYTRSLIEANLDPLVTIGADGYIQDVNVATEEVTGFLREELIGTKFSDYFTDSEKAESGYLQVFKDEIVRNYPLTICHRDGHETPVLYNAVVYHDQSGEVMGVFAAARDISAQIRVEKELSMSRQKYEQLFENSPVSLWLKDFSAVKEYLVSLRNEGVVDFRSYFASHPESLLECSRQVQIIDVNKKALQMMGFTDKDSFFKNEGDNLAKNVCPACVEELVTLAGGKFNHKVETVQDTRNGPIDVILELQVIPGFEYQFEQVLISMVDITRRVEAEHEMQIANEKYRVLFESFPLGIMVTDNSGLIVESNAESDRLLGVSKDIHVSKRFVRPQWGVIDQDGNRMDPECYASVRALKEGRKIENIETGIVKPDGSITWIRTTAAPLPLERYGVVLTYSDISTLRQTESALRSATRRMEIFTKVIRHGILNSLSILFLELEWLEKMGDDSQNVHFKQAIRAAEEIEENIILTRKYGTLSSKIPSWYGVKDITGGEPGVLPSLEIFSHPVITRLTEFLPTFKEKVVGWDHRWQVDLPDSTLPLQITLYLSANREEESRCDVKVLRSDQDEIWFSIICEFLSLTGISMSRDHNGEEYQYDMRIPPGSYRFNLF